MSRDERELYIEKKKMMATELKSMREYKLHPRPPSSITVS